MLDKLENSSSEKVIYNSISKELLNSLDSIKDKLRENEIKISEKSRRIPKLLKIKKDESNNKDLDFIYNDKTLYVMTMRKIKMMKKEISIIESKILALMENENLLKNDNFFELTNPVNLSEESKNIKIKKLEEQKRLLEEEINDLNVKINKFYYDNIREQGFQQRILRKKLLEFTKNIDKNKEEYNKKIYEIQEESKIRRKKMEENLKDKINEKNKKLDAQENKEKIDKKNKLKTMREKEKELIQKRVKENNKKLLQLKLQQKEKCSYNKYFYKEKEKEYKEYNSKLQKEENLKRREFMKHIDLNEFKEISDLDKEKQNKNLENNIEKTKKLKSEWSERKKELPVFLSQPYILCEKEKQQRKQIEEEKLENKKKNILNKIDYSRNKIPFPLSKKNDYLRFENFEKKEDKQEISDLNVKQLKKYASSKFYNVKYSFENLKKLPKSQSGKYFSSYKELKINEKSILPKKANLNILKNSLNNKFQINKKANKIDYLTDMRLKKEKRALSANNLNKYEKNKTNIFNNSPMSNNNLDLFGKRIQSLESDLLRKEKLLKLKGGIVKEPELGSEVCDLKINSITEKLNMINEIEKLY